MESTRLPRKMLLAETGKTLIEHTYIAASQSRLASEVIVATDHVDIQNAVQAFGGRAVLTDPAHPSGSDRLVEVAEQLPHYDLFVNVQGDEPEIEGDHIDRAIERLQQTPQAALATLATPLRALERLRDPACVKVVFDDRFRALYFSRSPIPMPRDGAEKWLSSQPASFFQHIGLYAYRREYLLKIPQLPAARIETIESLEQLRFLHAGWPIYVDIVPNAFPGIDTVEDYQSFVRRRANC